MPWVPGLVLLGAVVLPLGAAALPPSGQAARAAGSPPFVQQVAASGTAATVNAVLPNATVAGNRVFVEVGVWNSAAATAGAVTDNAGDTFTKIVSFAASDKTELSVWTAVVATGGTKPTVTARATSAADIGVAVVEYAGVSTAATVVDQQAHASGTTSTAATVSSGATAATGGDGELALGFY